MISKVRRFGGSGGMTSFSSDRNLMKFMGQHHSSSPLKSAALKIVRRALGYDIYYISANESERSCKRVPYSTPRKGGNFPLKVEDFKKFPFLANFAELKIIAVRIVSALNDSDILGSHKKISVMAVEQELSNLAHCICHYGKDRRMDILERYNCFNKHSIVAYNVGLHLDVFHRHSASFENKAIFHAKAFGYNHDICVDWEYSRGGGKTPREFHYALLDWGQQQRQRRRNAVIHRIIDARERVSQGTLRDYFANNPNAVNVANDVVWNLQNAEYGNNDIGNID